MFEVVALLLEAVNAIEGVTEHSELGYVGELRVVRMVVLVAVFNEGDVLEKDGEVGHNRVPVAGSADPGVVFP